MMTKQTACETVSTRTGLNWSCIWKRISAGSATSDGLRDAPINVGVLADLLALEVEHPEYLASRTQRHGEF